MNKVVNPRQNFGAEPFHYPDIIETSIGPVALMFTENEPGDPPMINALDLAHWQTVIGLPAEHPLMNTKSTAVLYTTFHFSRDGWHPNDGATYFKVDNADLPMPPHLQDELAGHMARWARDNQARFIKHERAQFFGQLADWGEMLNDVIENGATEFAAILPDHDAIDKLIESRWAQLVTPSALDWAKRLSVALTKMHEGINDAQAAFKAIADEKDAS